MVAAQRMKILGKRGFVEAKSQERLYLESRAALLHWEGRGDGKDKWCYLSWEWWALNSLRKMRSGGKVALSPLLVLVSTCCPCPSSWGTSAQKWSTFCYLWWQQPGCYHTACAAVGWEMWQAPNGSNSFHRPNLQALCLTSSILTKIELVCSNDGMKRSLHTQEEYN